MQLRTTYGERLDIDRRRRNETQPQAAARLGVSVYAYRKALSAAFQASDGPADPPVKPTASEACRILRRRAGLRIHQIAEELDVTPWWVCRMERGEVSADLLIQHWKQREGTYALT